MMMMMMMMIIQLPLNWKDEGQWPIRTQCILFGQTTSLQVIQRSLFLWILLWMQFSSTLLKKSA
jgi:hypothetical protein